jgi:hypothetical protein
VGASELKKTDGTEEDCYRENGNIRKANGGEFFESQSANLFFHQDTLHLVCDQEANHEGGCCNLQQLLLEFL